MRQSGHTDQNVKLSNHQLFQNYHNPYTVSPQTSLNILFSHHAEFKSDLKFGRDYVEVIWGVGGDDEIISVITMSSVSHRSFLLSAKELSP